MTDYKNMSVQAIFNSFDTHINNGEIDKKEEKAAKNLYGGIFNVKKGMNIDSFKAANTELLTDRNIHETLLNKIDESGDLDAYKGSPFDDKFMHLRSLIRGSAMYLGLRDIKFQFDDLKKYIEKSDRLTQLQNAFNFLDMRDTIEIISEGHKKLNYNSDGYIDPKALSRTESILSVIFGTSKNNIYDREKIEELLIANKIDCTAEDIETITLALHLRAKEIKNNQ